MTGKAGFESDVHDFFAGMQYLESGYGNAPFPVVLHYGHVDMLRKKFPEIAFRETEGFRRLCHIKVFQMTFYIIDHCLRQG